MNKTWDLSGDIPEHSRMFEYGKEKSYRNLMFWTFVIHVKRETTGKIAPSLWIFTASLFGFNISIHILYIYCIFIGAYVLECTITQERNISKWEVAFILYSWYEIIWLDSWPKIVIWKTGHSGWVLPRGLDLLPLSQLGRLQLYVLLGNLENWGLSPRVSRMNVLNATWNVFHNDYKQWLDSYLCLFFLKVLERKISTRQSREELIRRGVLKELPDQGEEINHAFKIIWSFLLWPFFHFLLKFNMSLVFGRESSECRAPRILLPFRMPLWAAENLRYSRREIQWLFGESFTRCHSKPKALQRCPVAGDTDKTQMLTWFLVFSILDLHSFCTS